MRERRRVGRREERRLREKELERRGGEEGGESKRCRE